MSLMSYKAPTETVKLDDENEVVVRGFSARMIEQLMQIHYEKLEIIFKSVSGIIAVSGKSEDFALRAGQSLFDLVKVAPDVIGTVIAMAAQEDEGTANQRIEAAMELPISLQVEIVTAIAKLTMKDVGAIKKMFGELKGVTAVVVQNAQAETPTKPTTRQKSKKASS